MSDVFLQHHGVKGMKWGVRKKREDTRSDIRKRYDSTKAAYKSAKKDYNKAYNYAYKYGERHPISQYVNKKKSAEADRRWEDALNKADAANKAEATYRKTKKERIVQVNKTAKQINKQTSVGEKLIFGKAHQKRAARYVVDHNMSVADAKKKAHKDAARNTALFIGAYAAVKLASRQPQYQVLNDAGKVIKNFY